MRRTTRFAPQVEKAIAWCNAVLDPEMPFRLAPTWDGAVPLEGGLVFRSAPQFGFESEGNRKPVSFRYDAKTETCVFSHAEPIPVYLVDGENLGEWENLFVPEGERCIVVNAAALSQLWTRLGTRQYFGGTDDEPTRPYAALICLLLLHECGHLHFQDNGSYSAPAMIEPGDFFRPSTGVKHKELRADRFAMEQILAARGRPDLSFVRAAYGYGIDFVLGDLLRVVEAGASVFEFSVDPGGYFDGKPKPQLILQHGASHPNLALRLLCMSAVLNPYGDRMEMLKRLDVIPSNQ